MNSDDIRCTAGELRLLRPLDEMSAPVRLALTRWLWDHGITPSTVALGLAIERDDEQNLLVWREQRDDGRIVKRWRFAPHDGVSRWPAAYPQALLEAGTRRTSRGDDSVASC